MHVSLGPPSFANTDADTSPPATPPPPYDHDEQQQQRHLSIAHVNGEDWVVGDARSDLRVANDYGDPYSSDDGLGGLVHPIVLEASDLVAGNVSLTFTLEAEVFSLDLLDPSINPDVEVLLLEMSKGIASARRFHDLGWTNGWSSVVRGGLSLSHVKPHSDNSLEIQVPAAHRYIPTGSEVIRLALPPSLFSCGVPAVQRPPSILFIHQPGRASSVSLPQLDPSLAVAPYK